MQLEKIENDKIFSPVYVGFIIHDNRIWQKEKSRLKFFHYFRIF